MREFAVVMILVLIGIVADLILIRHVIRNTDMIEVLSRTHADRGNVPSGEGGEQVIRWKQAKMMNGGFRASEVKFEPSNCDI